MRIKNKKIKNIGLLGGSFDPPHKGHLAISIEGKKKFKLDNIIWSITKKNPFKKKNSYNLYLILGADNLINFHKWYKWKSISQKCNILVFDRSGYKAQSLKSIAFKHLKQKNFKFVSFKKVNISSSKIRKI